MVLFKDGILFACTFIIAGISVTKIKEDLNKGL
jgi:hypothetical protein